MTTLILKSSEIGPLLNMEHILDLVEEAFKEKELGRVQMPPKVYLFYEKYNGDIRIMPSYLKKMDLSAVKIVNVHPNNQKYNLPTVMAIIAIIDPKTGAPLAIIDGTKITAIRTGAVSGVATKYLARKDSSVLSIVGTGAQAPAQLLAISHVLNLEKVKVFDIRKEVKKSFVKTMEPKFPGLDINYTESIEEAVKEADVLTTITPSRMPIINDEWVNVGTHINAIGADAPGKQELNPLILKRAKIVVDDYQQASHGGEINVPLENKIISYDSIYGELGEIVIQKKLGRTFKEEITVFCATGLGIFDAITANFVYKEALKYNVGTIIDFLS